MRRTERPPEKAVEQQQQQPTPAKRSGVLRRWWTKAEPARQSHEEVHALDTFTELTQEKQTPGKTDTKHLKFANTHARFLPEDLPLDYEPDDEYRGLDEYVTARRNARRKERRLRRLSSMHGADSDSDSDTSSSSSDLSTSGPQVISRLRALFGDSSDSSSSSSSDEDESDDDSIQSSATSRRRGSFEMDVSDHASVLSGHSRRGHSAANTPSMSTAFSPWTPRLSALTSMRRRRRRRRKRAHKERPAHIVKASRMARRNARRLRELSGGITEYTLFAPTGDARPNVLMSQSWKQIWRRMEEYFQYHRQVDGQDGDLGRPIGEESAPLQSAPEADWVLPPPALQLHIPDASPEKAGHADDAAEEEEPLTSEQERITGRHMSDVPLTPYFRSNISGDVTPSPMPFSSLSAKQKAHLRSDTLSPMPPGSVHKSPGVDTIAEEPAELYLPEAALDVFGQPYSIPERPNLQNDVIVKSSLFSDPWWLDIRCPTYKDMQQLSEHFPLHPLTVEDILKQESREKVERFDRLGYYFVVIRALDESYFRITRPNASVADNEQQDSKFASPGQVEAQVNKARHLGKISPRQMATGTGRLHIETVKSKDAKEGLEGLTAGSTSLYLVVFSDGVLSFHFEDLHKHTDRVRNKLNFAYTDVEHNADWIVHALYDSVVDAFSPYVTFAQSEVDYVEFLSDDLDVSPFVYEADDFKTQFKNFFTKPLFKSFDKERTALIAQELRSSMPEGNEDYVEYLVRRAKKQKTFSTYNAMHQSHCIVRLARVREVVMGLMRLLIPKPDVITSLRKRVLERDKDGREGNILALHFDDIYDHAASMLTQLQELEYALKHTQSTFLAKTRISSARFQRRVIYSLIGTTMVINIVFFATLMCTSFSMNVQVPIDSQWFLDNDQEPVEPDTHHAFGVIISCLVISPISFSIIYKVLMYTKAVEAKRKREAR